MAEIRAFRALRYNPELAPPQDAVSQPYDKITAAMQAAYYQRSPYNLVRVILGKAEAEDDETSNVYTRAAEYVKDWRARGVLQQDAAPAIYAYNQEFKVAASYGGDGKKHTRNGFIALGKLHDYSEGVVYRHEQTLAKPKSDRLNLLRATRTHFGQIFMLYNDPDEEVAEALKTEGEPAIEVRDEYEVEHRAWKVADPKVIAAVAAAMADKKLVIADGHHRYETALNFRNEERAAKKAEGGPAEFVMMTFVNMVDPGLVILPTHRVVHGTKVLADTMLTGASRFFTVEHVNPGALDNGMKLLRAGGMTLPTFLLVLRESLYLLREEPHNVGPALTMLSPRQRQMDVTILHKVLLEGVMGMSEESIRNQEHISYFRDAHEAFEKVRKGEAQYAFLMNPVRIEQVREVAFAGEVMPQKSTDFFPKLLSGLTGYAVE